MIKKEKSSTKSSAKQKTPNNSINSQAISELTEQVDSLKEFIKLQQDALLKAVAITAGAADRINPPVVELPPPPPPPPITREGLILELGKVFIEAWMDMSQRQNSRQLTVFNRMNKPDMQLLLKKILDMK